MSFLETVVRAKAHLREHRRVSVRALGLEFEGGIKSPVLYQLS